MATELPVSTCTMAPTWACPAGLRTVPLTEAVEPARAVAQAMANAATPTPNLVQLRCTVLTPPVRLGYPSSRRASKESGPPVGNCLTRDAWHPSRARSVAVPKILHPQALPPLRGCRSFYRKLRRLL